MSRIINYINARPGCIYRIALKNFMVYKNVEVFPGLSMNVIVGPNATGKSAFVSAIMLGLCGKPSVIGRGNNISAYVRDGCNEATIDIELYQQPGQRNIVITHNFKLNDVSKWYIDGVRTREDMVQQIITSLNIQADNFCQLLNTEKFRDFSNMDPWQLLRCTLSAVSGSESIKLLDELIQCRTHHNDMLTKLHKKNMKIKEYEGLNRALRVKVASMPQRQEHIEQQIEKCEKRKLWLEYKALSENIVELKNVKKQAMLIVRTHKNKLNPLEKEIKTPKKAIANTEKLKLAATGECHTQKEKIKESIDWVKNQEYELNEVQDSLKTEVNKLKTGKRPFVPEVGDGPIMKTNAAIATSKRKKLDIQYSVEYEITPAIRLRQNKCSREKRDIVSTQIARQRDLLVAVRKLQDNVREGDLWKVKLDFHRNSIVQQELQITEYKSEMHTAQTTLDNIKAYSKAKHKLKVAKRATQGKSRKPDVPYQSDFDELSMNLEEITERVAELTARRRRMKPEQMIQEYEERERTIESLRAERSSFRDQIRDAERKIQRLKEEWLPPVETLIRKIDREVGDMLKRLGCSGIIKLEKDAGDDDFHDYGIDIMVRFSYRGMLQPLAEQSGGERALSTALYLLALQRMATVPFRCGDEISLRMDPVMELNMFKLLNATAEGDNAQFFLTFKSLPNVEYNDKIMVHTIYIDKNTSTIRSGSFLERARLIIN